MSSTPDQAAVDRRRWIALAVVMTASFLDLADATIVNIAIPSIKRDLGASFTEIQWMTVGYTLTFAVGLITGGRLGDVYGRKKIFLIGVGGFTVASALCGVATGPTMLVAARVLLGAMAALMVPQVLSIILVTFPAEERGKVFGMYGTIIGIGAISGPLIGALLTQWNLFGLQWRPIFLVNVPIGVLGLLVGRHYIDESKSPQKLRLDLAGVGLVTLGLLMLLYPLTQGRELGWPAWGFLSMIGSLAVFAVFVRYERAKTTRDGSPLVELGLFRAKTFLAGTGVQLLFSTVFGLFALVGTVFLQIGLGWSPLRAAVTSIPFALATSAAATVSVQKLVPRFGRKVLQAGAVSMVLGALLFMWEVNRYGAGLHPWQIVFPYLLIGTGIGLIMAPITAVVLSDVPFENAGSASGLINTTNQVGMAFGLALTSVAFFTVVDAGQTYSDAFVAALWWVIAGLAAAFALVFALPGRPPAPQPAPAESTQSELAPVS